jgi:hypothetical protein
MKKDSIACAQFLRLERCAKKRIGREAKFEILWEYSELWS